VEEGGGVKRGKLGGRRLSFRNCKYCGGWTEEWEQPAAVSRDRTGGVIRYGLKLIFGQIADNYALD